MRLERRPQIYFEHGENRMTGKVYIIGAGPGDPELLTLKALKILVQADVVVYDRLVSKDILNYVKKTAKLIYAGKAPGNHSITQDEINDQLVFWARNKQIVARLHGGDPLIYGRGEEECYHILSNNIDCEIIPGIPSFIGAAAEYLIPLTGRYIASEMTISTGTYAGGKQITQDKIFEIMKTAKHSIFLMSTKSYETILNVARSMNPNIAIAIVERATNNSSMIIGTASELSASSFKPKPPTVIFVGAGPKWRLEKLGKLARYY